MISEAIQDASVNTMKRAAHKHKPSGLLYPFDDTTSSGWLAKTAVLQTDWMDPRSTKFHWKEHSKWSLYNGANTPAYITINRKWLKKTLQISTDLNLTALIETYPADYNPVFLPLGGTNKYLEFAPPELDEADDSTIPAGGTSAALVTPRQFGARTERFPYEPRPSFLQARPENLFNLPSNIATITNAGGAATIVDQETTNATHTQVYFPAASYTGGSPATVQYKPWLGSYYYSLGQNAASSSGGICPIVVTGMNFKDSDPVSNWQANNQESFIDAATGSEDPTLSYSTTDWSTAKEYNEMRNKAMQSIFKMVQRRYTIPPGKVLRLKFKSKQHCLSGTHLLRMYKFNSPWYNWDVVASNNAGHSLESWGWNSYLPCHGGRKSGFQEQWISISMRGPHMPDSTASNSLNTGPAEITLKIDHTVYTKLVSKNKKIGSHRTVQDLLDVPSSANMAFTYPNQAAVTVAATNTAGHTWMPPATIR